MAPHFTAWDIPGLALIAAFVLGPVVVVWALVAEHLEIKRATDPQRVSGGIERVLRASWRRVEERELAEMEEAGEPMWKPTASKSDLG